MEYNTQTLGVFELRIKVLSPQLATETAFSSDLTFDVCNFAATELSPTTPLVYIIDFATATGGMVVVPKTIDEMLVFNTGKCTGAIETVEIDDSGAGTNWQTVGGPTIALIDGGTR